MKILLIFFFFFFLLQNPNPSFSLSPDGLSLLALKSAIDQSSDTSAFSDWSENDSNPCHWFGISCMNITGYTDPRVVGITVSAKNLCGYIPSELGSLFFLRRLNLHGNQFFGSIPDQLFNASSLHSLFLYGNNFSGALPPSICQIGNHYPKQSNVVVVDAYFAGQKIVVEGTHFVKQNNNWSLLVD